MKHAISLLSLIPVRSVADDRSEQVTQILFGELVQILEEKGKWLFIQILNDSYQGWVSNGQLTRINESLFNELKSQTHWVNNDLVQIIHNKTLNYRMLLSAGSTFYNCNNNQFTLIDCDWEYMGGMHTVNSFQPAEIIGSALLFLHAPYQWGGKSAFGIDCSGFTQIVFKMAGIALHRDASQQARQGEVVNLIPEAQPGDLLFFDNEEGEIIHTGILLPDSRIIHAHQKVRIDMVDHQGIFNKENGKYSHKLRIIKRIVG
jgi:hypothetical protein